MSARDKAVSFEAIKVAMRQTKDGYALTLVVHPNDAPSELFQSPVGQRYVVALVEVGDDEQPVPAKTKTVDSPGSEAVKYAGMLCKEPMFWRWITTQSGAIVVEDQDEAAQWLREELGVGSRSEIASSSVLIETFDRMTAAYRKWAGIE